jgi:hypothetical protein
MKSNNVHPSEEAFNVNGRCTNWPVFRREEVDNRFVFIELEEPVESSSFFIYVWGRKLGDEGI